MENVLKEGLLAIEACQNLGDLQNVRNEYLSKKGLVTQLMGKMKDLPAEDKPAYGAQVNQIKQSLEAAFKLKEEALQEAAFDVQLQKGKIDLSLPSAMPLVGTLHPLTIVQTEIEQFFMGMGYLVKEGPEVELDYYNFERANIPQDHPARDMQDTFYINAEWLLRTHTTAIQTRTLEAYKGEIPVKVICPGKVFRKDDDDATHSHQFVQIEGLVVGDKISLADLKGTLELLARHLFGEARVIRFRPSYFQFTEPSVEVDVSCHICNGKGCPTCKQSGWIEILGAGMVHPNVLRMAGFDPEKVSGFAFGLGVERVALLKYGIDDIRHLYTNDLRFLNNFRRFE
ncbi:MAG TPA: phenylalanine--tRNA ligase subunit alpha [Erysipelotrichaceae bacterium]|nr:phenylalanine--tRNA ligase subunit alpha [Erysipelotrichaceae bacterium]